MSTKTPRRRLSREESQAITRERLIETAQGLFVSAGYAGASIRDIADKAGYSQGAFYSNFAGKEEILLVLLERHMAAEAASLAQAVGVEQQTAAAMIDRLEAWTATLNQDADWCVLSTELQLHASRSPQFGNAYRYVYDRQRRELGQLVERLFTHLGLQPPAPSDELAAGFMALAHGLALRKVPGQVDPTGALIMVFLRSLIASAKRLDASANERVADRVK